MYLPSQSIERDEVKLHDENNERPSVPISSRRLPSLSMVCILRLQSMVRILLLSVLVVKHTGTEVLNPPFSSFLIFDQEIFTQAVALLFF